jgi:hypothetical protein
MGIANRILTIEFQKYGFNSLSGQVFEKMLFSLEQLIFFQVLGA